MSLTAFMGGLTCTFPGCDAEGELVPAPVELPRASENAPASLEIYAAAACDEHRALVRLRLIEQHSPRLAAYRDGRPL